MKFTKKLMGLLLVMMLLLTAIPFQAFATGIEVIGPGATPPAGESGEVAEVEDEVVTFTVKVGCFAGHHDTLIETCGTVTMTEKEIEEYKSWGADAELAYEILNDAGSANKNKAVEGNIHSIMIGAYGRDEIHVWLKDCGNATGNGPSGDTTGPNGGTTTTCTLTIIDGASEETKKAYEGQKYSDFVGTRAAAGYEFLGWKNSKGEFINLVTDRIPAGGDTITAVWAPATKYFVTYDLKHDDDSVVKAGFTVSYGEHFFDKLYSFIPERKGYVFMGWKMGNYIITENNDEYLWQFDMVAEAIWADESGFPGFPNPPEKDGQTYLEIYTNGKTGELVQRVNLTKHFGDYLKDGYLTRAEAEAVAKKYVSAKNGYKLSFEGLFDEESWVWFTHDPETDGEASIKINPWADQYIFVMVKNVKASTNADPSNPKTGDFILTGALTMMAISSVSAAAVYVTGKKRK